MSIFSKDEVVEEIKEKEEEVKPAKKPDKNDPDHIFKGDTL